MLKPIINVAQYVCLASLVYRDGLPCYSIVVDLVEKGFVLRLKGEDEGFWWRIS